MAQSTTYQLARSTRIAIPTHALAIGALITANVIWAGSAAASKAVLPHVPPLTMASARIGVALVILTGFTARRGERVATGRAPIILGLTGVALFCACQNLGLVFTDAATTALIGAAIPVFTIGLAVPLLGERLRGSRLAGFLISMAGVAVIISIGSGGMGGIATATSLLPLASALSFALYNVAGRKAFGKYSAIRLVAGSTRYGLLFLLPATTIELERTSIHALDLADVLLLLYLGVGCSAVAFILCGYGLSHIEAGHGAVYGNLKPVVGVALAVMVLGEPLGGSQVAGGLLVLLGIGVTLRRWGPMTGPRRFSRLNRAESRGAIRQARAHALN